MEKFNSLEELFEEIINAYESAEKGVIWEYSRNIAESEKKLQEEIEHFRAEFARLRGAKNG